jgi:putative ABC transport system permease protein
VMPLFQQRRPDLNDALKQGSRGAAGSRASQRVRRALLIAEVAISAALLVGAGLMVRSFLRVMAVDTGVRTEGVLVASVGRYLPNVTPEQALVGYADEFRRMREALLALPGVRAVAGGSDIPYVNQPERRPVHEVFTRRRATREESHRGLIQGSDVLPGYFAALGIPLLEGRDFTEADTLGKQPVVILSRRAADVLFPDQPALGQQIRWSSDANEPWVTVIGIASNTIWNPAEREPGMEMYFSMRQFPGPTIYLLIRADGDVARLATDVRRTLEGVNPEFSIRLIEPMTQIASDSVWQRRLWGLLLGTFAALAVLLSAIGLYGVISYLVTQQTREIGVRMAIGATRGSIVRQVLRHGLGLTLIGISLGATLAAATSRFAGAVLFQISAFDLVTFVSAPAVLVLVSTAACAVPAWRASRIDPLIALREEL